MPHSSKQPAARAHPPSAGGIAGNAASGCIGDALRPGTVRSIARGLAGRAKRATMAPGAMRLPAPRRCRRDRMRQP